MEHFTPSDLRDPQPPLPGESERAKVAARAHELGRRRRLVQGGGALALVAAVAVSVAALTGGGGTGPGGSNRVEAASADTDTTVSTPVSHVTTVPTTVAPAPTTVAPAPAPSQDTTPAATSEVAPPPAAVNDAPVEQPVAPSTFTLSGTVTGNPANTGVSVLLVGPDGSQISASCDAAGNFSVSGLAAGDYQVIGTWTDNSGDPTKSASASAKFGTVSINANTSVSFSF
jgi:hypothetical protein